MTARIDHLVTSGQFTLDGGSWDVDNNVWIIGDDKECVVIDAAHDAEAILAAVGDRELKAIVLSHGHDDHIDAVGDLVEARPELRIYLHPSDRMLWDRVYPDDAPDLELADGQVLTVAGTDIHVLHTPGHSPGACCFYVPGLAALFSGDTLFSGGPGATDKSFSDFDTIIESIRGKLATLPADTTVHTGHGDGTTIGAESGHLDEWAARGY